MVTAVTFHPQREGVLAFGTAEGRVGVYEVFSGKHAAYATSHSAAVTVLVWCRPSPSAAAGDTTAALYSLAADGIFAWCVPKPHRHGDDSLGVRSEFDLFGLSSYWNGTLPQRLPGPGMLARPERPDESVVGSSEDAADVLQPSTAPGVHTPFSCALERFPSPEP